MSAKEQLGAFTKITRGFGQLPIARQLGLLLGLSASIALGFAVVLWAQDPNYRPLYGRLNPDMANDVLDSLQANGIPFKVDKANGTVLVPEDKIYDARFKLADRGLTNTTGGGFELLDKQQSLGTSRFMEVARYRHALEGELARTISSLHNVKAARVHLAISKSSAFVTDKKQSSASVFVDLASGQELTTQQVAAIVQLVASSVPELNAHDVSVVDQKGRLLTSEEDDAHITKTKQQFAYERQLETEYAERIERLLSPILGDNKVRARVSAELDFTATEQMIESFLPDSRVLRSEQVLDESTQPNAKGVGGIPGALTNKPVIPEEGEKTQANPNPGALAPGKRQATRNYELGKTVSHTRQPVGRIKRLSVAVVTDDHVKVDPGSGEVTRTPLTDNELAKITALVKNAVGYNEERGDNITVSNISFADPEPIEALPVLPIWKEAWFWLVVKTSAAGVFILILVFMVLRPTLKNLSSKGEKAPVPMDPMMIASPGGQLMPNGGQGGMMPMQPYRWDDVKQMATDDPKRIAQVMKTWVGNE